MELRNGSKTAVRLTFLAFVFALLAQTTTTDTFASAPKTNKSVKAIKLNRPKGMQSRRSVQNFAEVEVILNDEIILSDISALPRAPGSNLEVLDGGRCVRVQLPSSQVKALADKGADITVVRNFILVEGFADGADSLDDDVTTMGSCSGDYIYDYSGDNAYIQNNTHWWGSDIVFSGVPGGHTVTCIDVHYEVRNFAWESVVDVALSDEDYLTYMYILEEDWWGFDGDIVHTRTGITAFDGKTLSQVWFLWAADDNADGWGYIDYWWIKLYYGEVQDYCDASGICGYEYISNVEVGTINNSSSCSGYANYTAMSTEMKIATGYSITVTNGDPCLSDECGIWVDWNQDSDFDDAGETISVSGNPGVGPYEATITPPADAALGETRMRIRLIDSDYGTLNPCGAISWGEVEDYTINVTPGGYCDASGGNYTYEHVERVQVGDIDNTTGGSNYTDYTNLSTTMEIETGYEITVTNGYPYDEYDYCGVWVDWNQDEDFDVDDAEETISVSPDQTTAGGGVITFVGTITPPEGAALDGTRMRVRVLWSGTVSPCGTTTWGEVEDYTINVTGGQQFLNVSGHVTLSNGAPLAGVLLEAYDYPSTPTGLTDITDVNGYYEITLPSPWSGHIEPSKEDYAFSLPTTFMDVTTDQIQDFSAYYTYSGGFGTAGSPYLISTPADMNAIGVHPEDWDKYFKLIADVDLSEYTGTEFNVVGSETTPFTGVFDGNSNEISNFTYSFTATNDIGLFGYVDGADAEIKNLSLRNPNIDADHSSDVGALVGHLENGDVSNCHVEDGNVSVLYNVYVAGGLVGKNNGTISDCSSSVSASAESVGGLVGVNQGTISKSYSSGSVSGNNGGGLVGINEGTISESFSTANVSGTATIGGLVGGNWGGTISNSYSSGGVSGTVNVGGLVGSHWDGTISKSYSSGAVSGTTYVGGLVGYEHDFSGSYTKCFWDNTVNPSLAGIGNASDPDVIGKSTAEMQKESTFTDAGWDFTTPIWKMCECGDYPRLLWETVKYGGGRGTSDEPFLICTAEQMQAIGADSNDWDKHFKLMADIDLGGYTGTQFNIIGTISKPFLGVFDGDAHRIYNFTYESQDDGPVGIFGSVGDEEKFPLPGGDPVDDLQAEIKNVGLISPTVIGHHGGTFIAYFERGLFSNCYAVDVNVSMSGGAGGLIGARFNGPMDNCYASGIVSGGDYTGGLVGSSYGVLSRCYAVCDVSGHNRCGGLVGHGTASNFRQCYTDCVVSGAEDVGGLVGSAGWGSVENSYAVGAVSGTNRTGGLVGDIYENSIYRCYAACRVTGVSSKGGLIGRRSDSSVSGSFWDTDASGLFGSAGGIGLETYQMQTKSTFTDAGWDFTTPVWKICDGTNYPKLAWQTRVRGDLVCPDGVEINDLGVLVKEWLRPVLSADVWPDGGDEIVNFLDWAIFADGWQITNDIADLAVFTDQWLGRVLSADVEPDRGDDFVDFSDWAAFAAAWKSEPGSPNWDPRCDIAPKNGDDIVDMDDIFVFIAEWLRAGSYYHHLNADVAPVGGDGVVNMLDYCVLAENWLAGK